MSFPTTPILDNFNRADENPLSDGGKWTNPMFNASDLALAIVSNVAVQSSTTECSAYWNPTSIGPDAEVYMDLSTLPPATTVASCYLRTSGEGGSNTFDGYGIRFQNQASADLTIRKYINAVSSQLAAFTQTLANGDAIGLSVVGSLLSGYSRVSGTWGFLGSVTDSTYANAGHIGMTLNTGTTSAGADNFGGGTLSSLSLVDTATLTGAYKLQ